MYVAVLDALCDVLYVSTAQVTSNLPQLAEAGRSPRDSPRDSPRAGATAASSRARAGSTSSGSRLGASAAPRSSKGEAGPPSGRRSPLHQYAPAATALRSNSDTKTLDSSIAALGLVRCLCRSVVHAVNAGMMIQCVCENMA